MAQFPAQTLPRPEIYSSNLDISEFFNRTFVYLPAVNGIEKTKIKTKEAGYGLFKILILQRNFHGAL